MKCRFLDEQIIGMIKEYEVGEKAQELCRRYGISDATFYKYKAKFGGCDARQCSFEGSRDKKLLTPDVKR